VGKKAKEDYFVTGVLLVKRLTLSPKEKYGRKNQIYSGWRNIFFTVLPTKYYLHGVNTRFKALFLKSIAY